MKEIRTKKKPSEEEQEKLQHYRDMAAERQRRKRKKDKKIEDEPSTSKHPKKQTRNEIKKQREKWRQDKAKYRKKLSGVKKRWIRQKDTERKRKSRERSKTTLVVSKSAFRSRQTLYNKTSLVRKSLPKSPRKRGEVLAKLQKEYSGVPQMINAEKMKFKAKKILNKRKISANRPNWNKIDQKIQTKRYLVKRSIEIANGAKHKRALPKSTKMAIAEFYLNNSRPLYNKRYATKHRPAYVMQSTLRQAFRKFKEENKVKVGFTSFVTNRPKNVRLLSSSHWEYCVCTVCQNLKYKLQALNNYVTRMNKPKLKIDSLESLNNLILCKIGDFERFHQEKCIYGACLSCDAAAKINNHYEEIILKGKNDELKWHHWEKVNELGKSRKKLVTKRKTLKIALEELIEDVTRPVQGTTFQKHKFQADWQQLQYLNFKKSISEREILMIFDFGRNRAIHHQDQAKCDYFNARQVTIHPIVMYYKSKTVQELTVRESLIMVSDDLKHDHFAVKQFLGEAVSYCKTKGIEFSKLVIYSDGCAAQYKGRNSLAFLSKEHIDIEWNYFGSDHGKAEADGELGSLNRSLDRAILGRQVIISEAKDIVAWGNREMSLDKPDSRRKFILVENINRIDSDDQIKTVNGIRSLHQVKNCQVDNKIYCRRLSCYCPACRAGDSEQCRNTQYTRKYKVEYLTAEAKKSDLVSHGSDAKDHLRRGPSGVRNCPTIKEKFYAEHAVLGDKEDFSVFGYALNLMLI